MAQGLRNTVWAPHKLMMGLFVAGAMICLGGLSALLEAAEETPAPNVVAVFDLSATITDKPAAEDPLFGSLNVESLHSLLTRIKKAGEDEKVAAVVVFVNDSGLQLAQIQEVREVLQKVKEKKPVYSHADSVKIGTYVLLSSSTRASVVPIGDVWITGLYMEGLYVRGLLDMIGVQPDFLTCGEYKSAAEMFMLKESSPEASEMTNWLIDSLYGSIVKMISEDRKVDPKTVESWIDRGIYSAEAAREAGLIDAVEGREDLLAFLKKTHGATIRLEKSYGKKTAQDLNLDNPFAVLQLWAKLLNDAKSTSTSKNTIAVVHVDGPIMLGKEEPSLFGSAEGAYSESIRKALNSVADEPRIRGVVLRVNSPGGSAVASEVILQAVRDVQAQKPVIVSMGHVAASGGYYVASRANRIFADSTTITGSIGVVAGKLATDQMWKRIGVNFSAVQRGRNSGMMRSAKAWTKPEKEELQGWMDEIYTVFKQHVTEGRKDKLKKPIDEIAGGRVYTGAQALELGLVDELGSLNDAIAFAAKEAGLDEYELKTFPKHKSFLETLVEETSGKKKDEKHLSLGLWSFIEPALEGLDPDRSQLVRAALQQLDGLHNERVMLTAPLYLIGND